MAYETKNDFLPPTPSKAFETEPKVKPADALERAKSASQDESPIKWPGLEDYSTSDLASFLASEILDLSPERDIQFLAPLIKHIFCIELKKFGADPMDTANGIMALASKIGALANLITHISKKSPQSPYTFNVIWHLRNEEFSLTES